TITEEVMLKMTRHAQKVTGMRKLCMAGGVALNCVANGRVLREVPFEDIWIQPAAGDAGGALGIALAVWHRYLDQPRVSAEETGSWQSSGTRQKDSLRSQTNSIGVYADRMNGSYLGPQHSEAEIEEFLRSRKLPYRKYSRAEIPAVIADILVTGKIVGLH